MCNHKICFVHLPNIKIRRIVLKYANKKGTSLLKNKDEHAVSIGAEKNIVVAY